MNKTLKRIMFSMPGMLTCGQVEEFLDDYLSGELPKAKRIVFQIHLAMCRDCVSYIQAYKRSIELGEAVFSNLDASAEAHVPEGLISAILKTRTN